MANCKFRPQWLLNKKIQLVALFLYLSENSYANDGDTAVQGLQYRAAIVIIAFVIARISRGFLLRKMNTLMMTKAKEETEAVPETLKTREVNAVAELVITELDASVIVKDAIAVRENMVKNAKKGFNRLFFTDLVVIAVYAGIGYVFIQLEGLIDFYSFPLILGLYLLLWLICIIGRYLGYRHQFRAYTNGLFGFVKPIWKILFWPFQTRWCMLLSLAVMLIVFWGSLANSSLILFTGLLIHIGLIYLSVKKNAGTPNFKLLILRVFLIDKTSTFTFNGLVNFWKHFGSYYTVADPSFYKVNWKKKFNYYFPIYIIVIFLVFTQLTDDAGPLILPGLFTGYVLFLIICAVIFIMMSLRRIKRTFISNEEVLLERLRKLDRYPKRVDNTFKELPVMCYDNTWKTAVDELVKEADVILMDLRGFSEANKGCEYEIDFLFDHVRAECIVFLCYPDSVPLIRKTIQERWKMLLDTSPNLKATTPQTRLYIAGKQNERDIQGLIDILLETAALKRD